MRRKGEGMDESREEGIHLATAHANDLAAVNGVQNGLLIQCQLDSKSRLTARARNS